MTNRLVDTRGYAGSERNRVLSPEDVIWARGAVARREVSPKDLARRFGMSVDSVRRMLRGDTYGNVADALPREKEVAQHSQRVEDGGAMDRLLRGEGGGAREVEMPEDPLLNESIIDTFLKGE